MNILDELAHTTVRIETEGPLGRGAGTGFFFTCAHGSERAVPMIVSNKHVVKGAARGRFVLTARKDDQAPDFGNTKKVELDNFESLWVPHPDPEVDLAAMATAPLLIEFEIAGFQPFYKAFEPEIVAKEDDFREMSAVEEILMIGYPQGLWDSQNNMPIMRRGVTATAPYLNFEGRPEFMIDCAVFKGSSGSPVLLFDKGASLTKAGGVTLSGFRVKLLGVLTSVPEYDAYGEIRSVPIPTALEGVPVVPMLMNLGYCVRADQLLWFVDNMIPEVEKREEVDRRRRLTGETGFSIFGR